MHPLDTSLQPPAGAAFSAPVAGTVRCVQALGCALGEGLLWSVRERALYWVDILACHLHRWNPASGALQRWTFAEEISALAERSEGPGLIVTLRRGFALFDPATDAAPRYLHQPEPERTGNRFNDGKCDAQGRFWAGSMDFACQAPTGALYRYDPDGRCTRHDDGFAVTNGPTWSGTGQHTAMYFNATSEGNTYRYDCDPAMGTVSNKTLWKHWLPADGLPDGMTTDALGRVWIAHWGGGCVTCHDPVTAVELGRVSLPVSQVTTCAFGGADLRTLFITSARVGLTPEQLAAEPLAGALFAVDTDSLGVPAHLFGC
ncbi:sugar lactone lactonase YvrE [Acidovorax sp. 69]|uniref:SMP-30/gluconolactonase/LRE family protein n=1 Tax=Acidovorax sp. 69 TaxID=2035202 RepID=UPI000C2449CF|nr:SMP-30/gluconolactonase/LRE family protein [Acidovorax sp. 69]PJI96159.1 sugar lactone lactonase YvrE [Acidovorax sp. 69]